VFEGSFFTMTAVADEPVGLGDDSDKLVDCEYVTALVRECGGRPFEAKTVGLVANPDRAYAVCPAGLAPPRLSELLRRPDFRCGAWPLQGVLVR
jgi:hypothetical protein